MSKSSVAIIPPVTSPATSPVTPPTALPTSEQTEDRRSLRTKRLLREAFAQLVIERGLDGFSVGELTDQADINRGTFYAHYRDMADLLRLFEDEIIESLVSLKPRIQAVSLSELFVFARQGRPPQVTVDLFVLLREHGSLLRGLLSPSGDAVFQAELRDRLCTDLVRSVLYDKYTRDPKPLTEYYISYYASAMLGLIQRWLERDMAETPDEMARILLSIMMLRPGDSIELMGETDTQNTHVDSATPLRYAQNDRELYAERRMTEQGVDRVDRGMTEQGVARVDRGGIDD